MGDEDMENIGVEWLFFKYNLLRLRLVVGKNVEEVKIRKRLFLEKEVFMNGSILVVFWRINRFFILIDVGRGKWREFFSFKFVR